MLIDLFVKVHQRGPLDPADREALEGAIVRTQRVAARELLVREGAPLSQSMLLLDGFIIRYKDGGDGRRQILALHVPGDFVDLHSYPLKRLEHSVAAVAPSTMAVFPHEAIARMTERSARLTRLLWRSTLIDAAMNRQWLVSIGTQTAVRRLAHLFCELYVRLDTIGRVRANGYDLPLTQTDLGEATSLTSVHANRMLRELRERGLMEFRTGRVTVLDFEGLAALGEFDPAYLFLS